ncbi:MAG: type II toxin-antitoxin system HicB family antitoxin [Patescibacteria group bacterium]
MPKLKQQSKEYSYTVLYHQIKGGYEIAVPVIPGLVSFGRNLDEARAMARDAITCYLGAVRKEHSSIPAELDLVQEKVIVMA